MIHNILFLVQQIFIRIYVISIFREAKYLLTNKIKNDKKFEKNRYKSVIDQLSKESDYYSVGNDWIQNTFMNKHVEKCYDIKNMDNNDYSGTTGDIKENQFKIKYMNTNNKSNTETIGRKARTTGSTQVRAETRTEIRAGTGVRDGGEGTFNDREQIIRLLIRHKDDMHQCYTSDFINDRSRNDMNDKSDSSFIDDNDGVNTEPSNYKSVNSIIQSKSPSVEKLPSCIELAAIQGYWGCVMSMIKQGEGEGCGMSCPLEKGYQNDPEEGGEVHRESINSILVRFIYIYM
jgi:hypothetical protein